MTKPRSDIADYAVYLVVRIVVCILQALPYLLAAKVAAGLAWLAYHIDRRHREAAHDNLQHAYPEMPADQRDRMVRQVYQHFCMVVVEIAFLQRKLHVSNWRKFVDPAGCRTLMAAFLTGRPLLMVTGHFGNWEMGGYGLSMAGLKMHSIARPLDNPYLDDLLRSFRERTGQKLLAKKGDFDQMQELLAQGQVIGTLGDQDAGSRGLFVDFFGRPASTHKAIALLALEYNVPMVVIGAPKVGEPMRYRMVVDEIIDPQEYAGRPDAVRAITQRFTASLEKIVRVWPEQYFWLHRRWKHEPVKRKQKQTAAA